MKPCCIHCGRRLDEHSGVSVKGSKPAPGDYTVCLFCGTLMVYGTDMLLRSPTDDEIHTIGGDPLYLKTQKFAALVRRTFPHRAAGRPPPRGSK